MATKITYQPRNTLVLIQIINLGKVGNVAMPDIAEAGKKNIVEAIGPKVEDLQVGDDVLVVGEEGKDFFFLPGTRRLLVTKEMNVVLKRTITEEE